MTVKDKWYFIIRMTYETQKLFFHPVGENVHKGHILRTTTVPAQVSDRVTAEAKKACATIGAAFDVVGMFAVEFFVLGEVLYVNEIALRPHNSGHYTLDACNVSQFEQHIRALVGLPLVPIYFHGACQMVNVLGEDLPLLTEEQSYLRRGQLHLYGKTDVRDKRKMGHVTFVGQSEKQ